MEAGRDKNSLSEVVETEVEIGASDGERGDGPDDDAGLEHQAARHTAKHHPSLCKASHEVEEAGPAAEDGDEDNDECCDPGHVLQLPVTVVIKRDQLTVVFHQEHADIVYRLLYTKQNRLSQ